MSIGLGRGGTGKLRMTRPGELLLWCPACNCGHLVDVHALSNNGATIGWDGDFKAPTFGQVLRYETDGVICEFELRGGVLYFTRNCSHDLRGQPRHLEEYPI